MTTWRLLNPSTVATGFLSIPALAGCVFLLLAAVLTIGRADAATLTSLSPTTRIAGGAAFTLTVNGTGFINGSSVVQWNGSSRPTTFVSATRLTAAIPATDIGLAGIAQVTALTSGASSNALTLTINNPAPTNSSLSPTSTIAGGPAFTLTVNGTRFVPTSMVRWNATDRPTTYVSATQLRATIGVADIATAGTASVRVFNPTPGGGISGARTFTINNPLPATTGLSPTSATAGGPGFSLTVTGTNFVPISVVRWNGSNRTTTYVSATQLTAAITAADIATAQTRSVTVFNPTPGGGTSTSQTFTIVAPNPVPAMTGLSPASAVAGGEAFSLTVTGTNFISSSVVQWNRSPRATTYVSATTLAAAIPASDLATAGSASVTVFNPTPGGGTSTARTFSVVAPNPVPGITEFSPSSAAAGGPAFTLTVTGNNFISSSVVQWNGSPRATTYVSATTLAAAIPASDLATAGSASVTVFNPTPGGGTSTAQTFTILPDTAPPTITGRIPAPGATGVATNGTITATFSEALNPSTLTTSTFILQGPGTTSVAASLAYTGATFTATLTPTSPLNSSTLYTATVAGSVTDVAGNALGSSVTWSFTTVDADSTPPAVTSFNLPATATTLTVPISSFTATDNLAVTGYLLTETANAPVASAPGWTATAPTAYVFTTAGSKTLYAWAKDAAGNVSTSRSATVTITLASTGPEPAGWYAGDPHTHRSCGGAPEAVTSLRSKMAVNDLASISLLADMGNGEVQNPTTDLPLVTGQDAIESATGRTIHWDAEWHWDATYTQYPHQALGGHVFSLGLTEAQQVWQEYTYPVFEWAHQRNGIAGFAHMQYLDNGIPESLNCCIPIEYPVEVALGAADFISEDVTGSDSFIQAYYRLLNAGFRPGFAAGTDYPCGINELGTLLTYVQAANGQMTYRNWIEGIAAGRTVITRTGHREFLALTVNGIATPGDEINLPTGGGALPATIVWTATEALSGTIELVHNGVVVASQAAAGTSTTLSTTVTLPQSGWLAARRMDANSHQVHTAAVFVIVGGKPIRASVADAQFYVQWMDTLLQRTSPGGVWAAYFPTQRAEAQARYQAAKTIFQQIALEAAGTPTIPVVVTTTPLSGATGVTTTTTVTASFSKAIDPATLTTSTFTLAQGGAPVPATVSYTAGTLTATLTPSASLAPSSTYTATVKGGATGVKDTTGTPLATDVIWSFTTAGGGGGSTCPCTIWPATATPDRTDADTNAVELGVKFRADVAGSITALRFYKTPTTTGTHVGHLWTSSGTLLATVTFTNESASGWQQASFASPVAITANTTYIASYHTPIGRYAVSSNYFATTGVDNPPLHALSTTAGGGNGVYRYGAAGSFPNQTYQAENYWVDVVLTTDSGTTAPSVTGHTPAAGATAVATTTAVTATFSKALSATTVNTSTFLLQGPSGTVPATVSYNSSTFTATLTAASVLAGTTTYTVTIKGGTSGVKDVAGNPLTSDVTWSFTTGAPDTTLPAVTGQSPAPGATGIPTNSSVTANFSEAIALSTLTPTTFTLQAGNNPAVSATLSYNAGTFTATLTPASALAAGTAYTAKIVGGPTGVADLAGNRLSSDVVWSFTTRSSPAQGPGGPILVVTSTANPFTTYYAEILRAEGLNAFATLDVTTVEDATLASYDVVLLGEMDLTPDQVSMFTTWVNNGGNLIAFRPDKELASLLGLTDVGSTLVNAYLLIDTTQQPGAGLVAQTIQYHGTADRYTLNGATSVAALYSNATTATTNPAVTLRSVGTQGGQAAAFTYDLARSVVYTRQGNPAWAGQERDGFGPIRPNDLFFGNASGDPQPDWVDLTKVVIPQADEQQRLLVNLLLKMTADRKPLPRFWYFPRNLTAVVVMTGDDHANNGTQYRFDADLAQSPTGCAVDAWECLRSTSYLDVNTPLADAQAAAYTAQGFEVGLHLNTGCDNWTPDSLDITFTNELAAFRAAYPSVPLPITERTHCIVWSDWATMAVANSARGIRLDTNYYYWPGSWLQNRPGFFTGSGIPMRFATTSGSLIDVYQATTQMTDESDQTFPFTIDTLLDNALGPLGYYGAFTVNAHTDATSSPVRDAVVASALTRGVPVVSAKQLLTWLDSRSGSTFSNVTGTATTLDFTIGAAPGATGLHAMVPIAPGQTITSLSRNGSPADYVVGTVKGVQYAFVVATAGSYQVTFAADTTPPTVSTTSPASGATGVATTTAVTVTFSEAVAPATVTTSTLQLRDPSNALVATAVSYNAATRTATLTPSAALQTNAGYTITVVGGANGVKDLAGNPLAQDVTSLFSTDSGLSCPCSVFPTTAVPAHPAANEDPNAVELGMKFQPSVSGSITGIRFYKGATNTGTHVGRLWTSTGTLLASVNFTNETISGWQQATLSTPIQIQANTTYVVSYHTATGNYAYDAPYFTAGVVNGPLTALANGAAGGNGVYLYGPGGFPNQTWQASNYWVDVVFVP